MSSIPRLLTARLSDEITRHSKSVLLLGPRQVGKSTLLQSLHPRLTLNLADESAYREHLKDPGLIRRQVEVLPADALVLVDEVQRIPSILNTIQALIDEHRSRVFLLTGSSARKLRGGKANLLPGRVLMHSLHPLTFWELEGQFDLDRALTLGTLPEPYLHPEYGAELLGSYIDIYLREEIQAESLVRDLGGYARFLDVAAEVSGEILNINGLASDSEIPKETLRRHFDLLEDTLLVHRLPGYTDTRGSRKPTQRERILFFDLGVRNSILRQQRNHFTDTQKGPLFEQWLILQLLAYSAYHFQDWRFYHYRDDTKHEVDLIIDTGPELLAIEIKYSTGFRKEWLSGLKAFLKAAKKPVKAFVVYRGSSRQLADEVSILPYEAFLRELPELTRSPD